MAGSRVGWESGYLIYSPESRNCKSLYCPRADGNIAYIFDRMRHLISISADITEVFVSYEDANWLGFDRTMGFSSPAPTAARDLCSICFMVKNNPLNPTYGLIFYNNSYENGKALQS